MSEKRPDYTASEAMFTRHQLTDAQRRIYDFCSAVRRGDSVTSDELEYIVSAFERHMTGEADSLDESFGLKRGRGAVKRLSTEDHARRVEIASAVLVAREQVPDRKLELIFDDLVALYHEKASFIQDCYEKHRADAVEALGYLRMLEADPMRAAIAMYHDATKRGRAAIFVSPPKNLPRK